MYFITSEKLSLKSKLLVVICDKTFDPIFLVAGQMVPSGRMLPLTHFFLEPILYTHTNENKRIQKVYVLELKIS